MDVADIGSEREEERCAKLIAERQAEANKPIVYTGFCLYCDTKVQGEKRFCDVNCRNDYDRENKLLANAGRK